MGVIFKDFTCEDCLTTSTFWVFVQPWLELELSELSTGKQLLYPQKHSPHPGQRITFPVPDLDRMLASMIHPKYTSFDVNNNYYHTCHRYDD